MTRAFLAGLLLACACSRRAQAPAEERSQTMEGLTMRQSYAGRAAWTLKSKLAVLREDEKRVSLEAPSMEFTNKGKPASRVTAAEGEVEVETHDVRLSSGVVLDSFEDKSRLETSELVYSSKIGRFRTDKAVVVRRPEGVLTGVGLDASPDLTEIRLYNQSTTLNSRP